MINPKILQICDIVVLICFIDIVILLNYMIFQLLTGAV